MRCPASQGRPGDLIEAYAGDDLVAAAPLRRAAGGLEARLELGSLPLLEFPTTLRLHNRRTGQEIAGGPTLPDVAALMALAGPPVLDARFVGLDAAGLAFRVAVDRLDRHPRDFLLRLADVPVAAARSRPGASDAPHDLTFAVPMPPVDTGFSVVEAAFGVVALSGRFDAAALLAGAMAQLVRLGDEVAALRDAQAALRRRLDTAVGLGRETLLLDRLDLFYLLLSERIERAVASPPAPLPAHAAENVWLGPGEVDGLGVFEVESDGANTWRWFGPEVTLALRGPVAAARRVVLYFHGFGDAAAMPEIRVSAGGASRAVRPRALQDRYALDIELHDDAMRADGLLILHLSFDRHRTTEADPRLLAGVFCGAEIVLGADDGR